MYIETVINVHTVYAAGNVCEKYFCEFPEIEEV